jgi:hypothetical protein
MPYVGVVLHHSACPSINGKGYDFYITTSGAIVPGAEPTSPDYVHVCVQGDFGVHANNGAKAAAAYGSAPIIPREQLFVLQKLLMKLAETHGFEPAALHAHNDACPGRRFPWGELVISAQDGYH